MSRLHRIADFAVWIVVVVEFKTVNKVNNVKKERHTLKERKREKRECKQLFRADYNDDNF